MKSNYWCDVLTASADYARYSSARLVVKVSIDVSNFSSQITLNCFMLFQYVTFNMLLYRFFMRLVTYYKMIQTTLRFFITFMLNLKSFQTWTVRFKTWMVSLWYLVCISVNKRNHYKEPNPKIIWSLTKLLKKKKKSLRSKWELFKSS